MSQQSLRQAKASPRRRRTKTGPAGVRGAEGHRVSIASRRSAPLSRPRRLDNLVREGMAETAQRLAYWSWGRSAVIMKSPRNRPKRANDQPR
jgi:hypothetical protein